MSSGEVGISDLRDTLKTVVEDAQYGKTTFVTHRGNRVAAVIPPEDALHALLLRDAFGEDWYNTVLNALEERRMRS